MSLASPTSLSRTRCLVHPDREAVGRCPECGHFFCRECLIEHEGKMTCARCLAEATAKEEASPRSSRVLGVFKAMMTWSLALVSFLLAWTFFYAIGRLLIFLRYEWEDMFL